MEGRRFLYRSQGVAHPPSRASFPPHFSKIVGRHSLGTTHVPKMRLGVSKGMLPVKTTCSNKILMMAATKHGHQPARRLGWAALAYHKQEGAIPDPGLQSTACTMM